MQLDSTNIAVRERNGLEILDMSLQVTRAYFRHVLGAALIGALPFAIINALLLWNITYTADGDFSWRYLWLMSCLIFIEAPWASAIVTTYLGAAVFDEGISVRQATRETWRHFPQLLWCQGIVRGVVPALLVVALSRMSEDWNPFTDAFLMLGLLLYATAFRASRPFINEIVLLEHNPIRARSPQAITVGKRSKYLHDPSFGDMVVRWMAAALVGSLMTFAFLQTVVTLIGMLFGYWRWGMFMLHVGLPSVLWIMAGYMAVVRYLNYLDLRIRHEGWEVELRLRAEAVRLASKLT